jgi:hypothetical protein
LKALLINGSNHLPHTKEPGWGKDHVGKLLTLRKLSLFVLVLRLVIDFEAYKAMIYAPFIYRCPVFELMQFQHQKLV